MKRIISFSVFILTALILISFASAQAGPGFRGQSMNGATGLFSIPSGLIGWEGVEKAGLDFGYRIIYNDDYGMAHIPAITATMSNFFEISAAFDIQPEMLDQSNNDLLLGLKIKLSNNVNTSICIGGSFQFLNIGSETLGYISYQPYIAITYIGTFFTMPAETTLVFGKTFYANGAYSPENNTNIDFGMGFDLVLFPEIFGKAIHWIIDFANFSYSDNAWPNAGGSTNFIVPRGVLNTGFRIDLSAIPIFSKLKILIDFMFNDLFDDGSRSYTVGGVFGFVL